MTSTKTNKTLNRYLAMINIGTMKESSIVALRSWLKNNREYVNDIRKAIEDQGFVNITEEQSQKGIGYLRDKLRTPSGQYRRNNPFNGSQEMIIDNFSHFKFIGLHHDTNGYWHIYSPIYRCYSKNGSFFDYAYPLHRAEFRFM